MNRYRKGSSEALRSLIEDFLESGACSMEITRDLDGEPLEQRRIDSLRTQIYQVASANRLLASPSVASDAKQDIRRLYLVRKPR